MTGASPAELAPRTPDWTTLAELIAGCTVCAELAATRNRTVPGVLPSMPAGVARLMLVGEAPGATEDEVGLPFVGRSGELLDRLLVEAGTDRAQVAISNVLKCRPPGNRSPRRGEVQACRPWLQRQLELAEPDVVVALGTTAVTWFFGTDARIGVLRGEVFVREQYRLLASYHPSAALRFGPNGAPIAALREDLAHAVRLLGDVEAAR